jgi:hypothetical protein
MVPVWVGEANLADSGYTLYHTDSPCELQADIPASKTPLSLELEVTYYYAGIGRADLPIYIALENQATKEFSEYKTNIPLNVDGQWLGVLEENGVDYSVTHIVAPAVTLPAGKYTLKIYSDDDKTEKIFGVAKIIVRLYEQQEQKGA